MKPFRWGVFGTGVISANFIAGLSKTSNTEVSFVASRSLARAEKFATDFGIPHAIEGYAEAAKSRKADAIYIATPPSVHSTHALDCIEAGVPVLVEKPLASSEFEVKKIVEAARSKSVFAMEAMWTRFLPAAQALKEKIVSGEVGEVRMVSGNFGASKTFDATNKSFDLSLGGGAVGELGVYPLSLAQWLFGTPEVVQALGTVGSTGIDEDASFQLRYPGEVIGSFFSSIRSWVPNNFHVMGTHGLLGFNGPVVRPYGLNVMRHAPLPQSEPSFGWRSRLRQHGLIHLVAQLANRSSHNQGKRQNYWYAGNGYHYEADEVMACIQRGALESDIMPLSDSIAVASTVDKIINLIREH